MKFLIQVWRRQDKRALAREALAFLMFFCAIWFFLLLATV